MRSLSENGERSYLYAPNSALGQSCPGMYIC
jgi:hypothetical protein